ncbi:Ankyrin repeat domain protein [Mycena indigotica]|uniref:Ankyrin repeat domain protein n=1 Tax=Mycena indigotica TaxID=2126181 RepID=A0A8H6T547_9AGAR|nr:Ankyrin repeat domain protein [Mycena indigotica]KAF7310107.1 Ankyrin repeat domain protein [Mycena indigotica]
MASFTSLPPELVLLIAAHLSSTAAMNALAQTYWPAYHLIRPELHKRLFERRVEVLLWAAGTSNTVIVERLLKSPFGVHPQTDYPARTQTPLHAAAGAGSLDIVHALLAADAEADAIWTTPTGNVTPFHRASDGLHFAVMDVLLARGVDINRRKNRHEPFLHAACAAGNPALVEYLLERGADPAISGDHGPALVYALTACSPAPDVRVIRLLLDYGADPNFEYHDRPMPYLLLELPATNSAEVQTARTHALALLLAYGVGRQATMDYLRKWRGHLGRVFGVEPDRARQKVRDAFREAERAIPDVMGR